MQEYQSCPCSTLWADVECQKVQQLPYDINGLVKFELPFKKEARMKSSKDGRPWAGFMTSRRSGFDGIRRLARCKGSSKCINDDCSYLKQFSKRNRVHFQTKFGESVCHSCGSAAVAVECQVSKVWEFNDEEGVVIIYHHGIQHVFHVLPVLFLQKPLMMQLPNFKPSRN